MRHLLFALLIALLPLRGWVGDAMATQMAAGQIENSQTQQPGATKTIAGHHDGALAAAHFDHEEAAGADCAGHSAGEDTQAVGGHCESCAACQACNAIALNLVGADRRTVVQSPALPHAAAYRFASADAALRHKPPIS